ncbi:MAG: aminoacyl-tRNA hydrolase [Thermodesulfovibrionales bacterium]|nr:aminoacyl-tRNA hydrolase [Thermodesulfovibrionales bacterium]
MWLITGLGNPGKKYEFTRHNVGFIFIDRLSEILGIRLRDFGLYMMEKAIFNGSDILLLKPMTYMNRSGEAVLKICREFNIPPERVVVVHDDLDMVTGKVRIRRKGSSGGHRGVQSIIEAIGENFTRLKIGIGRSREFPPEEYVLQRFTAQELDIINDAIERAIKKLPEIISLDILKGNKDLCQ